MKTIKFVALLLAIGTMAACQKEETEPTYGDDPLAVKISASVDAIATRSNPLGDGVTSTTFNSGDMIAMSASGQASVKYTYDGTSWTPEADKYLKWNSLEMNFSAYYPVGVNGASMTDFALPKDQSTLEAIQKADYMIYSGNQPKAESVRLALERKMVRVVVAITFNDQYASGYTVEDIVVTGNTDGYSYGQPRGGTRADVKSYRNSDGKFYALLTPTSNIDSEGQFIAVTVTKTNDGTTETLNVKGIPTINSGKSCEIALVVGKNLAKVTNVTVKDWGDEKVIPDGEAPWNGDEWDGTYATSFKSGAGTKESPFLIQTAEELALLSTFEYHQNPKSYYKLMTDVDLKYLDWTPIGSGMFQGNVSNQATFTGAFDGNGHTIMGLKVTANNIVTNVGLFGKVAPNHDDETVPSIQNLIIKDAKIYAGTTVEGNQNEHQSAGILAGHISRMNKPGGVFHTAKIKECHVTGTILQVNGTTAMYVGGAVGYAQGAEIEACSTNITIDTRASCVGGLLGYVTGTSIKNSRSEGSIKGTWSMGGFAGGAGMIDNFMTIDNCIANVNITALDWNVGGFVGFSSATIANCTASGNINSINNMENPINSANKNVYRTGGFVGTNKGTISLSVYKGTMTFIDDAQYYGGFVGCDNNGITNSCRFDGTKNPNLNPNGLSTKNDSSGANDILNTCDN